jgi:hypothetical protein
MTDRDHFAAAALTGLLASRCDIDDEAAERALWLADAMLRERAVTEPMTQPTLTDEERVAIDLAAGDSLNHPDPGGRAQWISRTLRGLLERTL